MRIITWPYKVEATCICQAYEEPETYGKFALSSQGPSSALRHLSSATPTLMFLRKCPGPLFYSDLIFLSKTTFFSGLPPRNNLII